MRVAFLHPDLGIGGAEQLVVNLALCCKNLGWDVKIFTPFYDPNRAFSQLKDGTIPVEVRGDIFPRRIFGRCQAMCDYIRILLAAIYLILYGGNFDIIVVDQIPIALPLLKLRFTTFFYCHYPDKLLCLTRDSFIKRCYRFVIDHIEELTLLIADIIVVNSKFTQNVFKENFRIINKLRDPPKVLYPAIDLTVFDKYKLKENDLQNVKGLETITDRANKKVIVSLNRYERKKNLSLAVTSFKHFLELKKGDKDYDDYILVIAGGYDDRLSENIEEHIKLQELAGKELLNKKIFFLRSISDTERCILLKSAFVVLYTPKNEHFGIVPVESMYCGSFVIAHNSGGPMESIDHGKTGFRIDNEDSNEWGKYLKYFFEEYKCKKVNPQELRRHVEKLFSLESMKDNFRSYLEQKIIIRN